MKNIIFFHNAFHVLLKPRIVPKNAGTDIACPLLLRFCHILQTL